MKRTTGNVHSTPRRTIRPPFPQTGSKLPGPSEDAASILRELSHPWTANLGRNSDGWGHGLLVSIGGSCPPTRGNVLPAFEEGEIEYPLGD